MDEGGDHDHEHSDMDMDGMAMPMDSPSPMCYANNEPFLKTVAWCIHTHCSGIIASELEIYWRDNIAGRQSVQPIPKWTFQEALAQVGTPPSETLDADYMLNRTVLVLEKNWLGDFNAYTAFEESENAHERYGYGL